MINQQRPELDELITQCWQLLADGVEAGRHPFHTPVLASIGPDGPEARTVVLRHASLQDRQLICHSDTRSPKVSQLREQQAPRLSWLFYDREAKLQLRLRGNAEIHSGDALAQTRWAASTDSSKACYHAAAGPGEKLLDPAVPASTLEEGFAQFCVLASTIDHLDWLFLRAAGHWRAQFTWQDNRWSGRWVAP